MVPGEQGQARNFCVFLDAISDSTPAAPGGPVEESESRAESESESEFNKLMRLRVGVLLSEGIPSPDKFNALRITVISSDESVKFRLEDPTGIRYRFFSFLASTSASRAAS